MQIFQKIKLLHALLLNLIVTVYKINNLESLPCPDGDKTCDAVGGVCKKVCYCYYSLNLMIKLNFVNVKRDIRG